jgi:hypothetical protein
MDDGEQMVIVLSINLNKHIEISRGVMAFRYLGNFL